jgi:DNA-binding MurR/RpiR family transcriptional regulator
MNPKKKLRHLTKTLSGQKRKSAEYILAHPGEVAVYSLRKVASLAHVSPGTLIALARLVGYASYNAMRARFQQDETGVLDYFSAAARTLQGVGDSAELDSLITKAMQSDIRNIERLMNRDTVDSISQAAKVIHGARRVFIIGQRATFGVMQYLYYLMQLVRDDVTFLGGFASLDADLISGVTKQDVIVCCGFYPYLRSVIDLVHKAEESNGVVIAITDTSASPLMRKGRRTILFSVQSPWVVGSITSCNAIVQALVAQLTAFGGEEVLKRLTMRERRLQDFKVFIP